MGCSSSRPAVLDTTVDDDDRPPLAVTSLSLSPSPSRTSSPSPSRPLSSPTNNNNPPASPPRRQSTPNQLSKRPSQPRRPGSSSSSTIMMGPRPNLHALRSHAALPDPVGSLPPTSLLLHTNQTIAVFDAYPKAKYHFLVLPRTSFRLADGGGVKVEYLDDLKSLLTRTPPDIRQQIVASMADMAAEVEEMVKDEMLKTEGFEWKVEVGFHSVPSMKHVHLHVISADAISPALKTKKHYNSFRPDLGFFIPLSEVQRWIQQDEWYIHERVQALGAGDLLLDAPLSCFKCDEPLKNMPKLKAHLQVEWEKQKAQALSRAKRRAGRRGSSEDEDVF